MKAVLLLAHGSPDSASEADIREFLNNVTGGRALPNAAVEEIRTRYEQIGRSPLGDITVRQAKLLEKRTRHACVFWHAELASLHS